MVIKESVIKHFNAGAMTYDTVASVQVCVAERLALRFPQMVAPNILEIGCGTGLLSQHLQQRFPEASLWLTDISPAMLDKCQERLTDQKRVKLFCADGENFKFEKQFHLIVSSMALHWFTDLQRSLVRIKNHLLPQGHFVFALLGSHSLLEWKHLCSQFGIRAGTPQFPTQTFLQESLPGLELSVVMHREKYASAHAFLRSLKQLGAIASHKEYGTLSAGKLRKILQQFNQEITISYEVIYGSYRQP